MKKKLFILIAAIFAFCACQKVAPSGVEGGKTYDLSSLRFDFTIKQGEATKGVRTGWNNGDKVFIFIQGVNSAYLTVTYNGSSWSDNPTQVVRDGQSAPTLNQSGYLTAVYLPYGNSLTPTWDGTNEVWTFSGTNDYYYLKSEKTSYFITDTENSLATLGSYLYMDTADSFVQLFIPDDSASGNIQLACNYLIPAGIAGVALDGSVTETIGTQGDWVSARAETIADEKGYYASCKLSPRPGLQYYFAMNANGNYKHYYKQRGSALSGRGAYQLPALEDWLTASSSTYMEVNNYSWCTVNYGASSPWEMGTAIAASGISSINVENAEAPSDNSWNLLLDRTKVTWIQVSILGVDGFIVMDRITPGNYFFLPSYVSGSGVNYWSTSKTGNIQHYMKTDNEGTHEIADSDSPASAQVRLISTLLGGGFNPPENGGDI